jgi:hypothetical protein
MHKINIADVKKFLFVFLLLTSFVFTEELWVKSMTDVHKNFKGKKGTVACFGDSITNAKEFWATIPNGTSNCKDINIKELINYIDKSTWNLKGREYGNKGGWKITDGLEGVDTWLKKQNPEVAIVLFGTNDTDLGANPVKTKFEENLGKFVQKCLDNGTIVILTTPPPQKSDNRPKRFGDSAKKVAEQKGVPVVDYWDAILKRRPERTWFKTLISDDGTHPSWKGNDWSEEGLKNSGYGLRNYVTLKK